MIRQINSNLNSNVQLNNRKKSDKQPVNNTSFKGLGDSFIKGVQHCEKNPMLNVAVIDLATAIIPRSIWESFTNIFAGFEAFRRESSGLIINCLIPGFLALGAAKLANKTIMGSKADLSSCWADKDSINAVTDYYKNAPSTEAYQTGLAKYSDPKKARVYATHYNILSSASGVDGNETKKFSEIAALDMRSTAEKLTEATFEEKPKLSFTERLGGLFKKKSPSTLETAYHQTARATHITENISFGSGKAKFTSNLQSAMRNTSGLLRGIIKDGAESPEQLASIAKRAKKLVNVKSGVAMAIILPLAASAQYINRWITSKSSGVKGAPIYNDYGKNETKIVKTPEQEKKEKQDLLKQKFISVGSMVGVACLSMMKLPTLSTLKNIFQFKGQFPTMDQARAISTVTFGSRMAVADDKNELAEATGRDIVTFSSMYFLGDYAAKGYASHLENKEGVKLINRTKTVDKNVNVFKKIGNWIVNSHLKSTDELVADATHSLEDMKHMRTKCQIANLASSLLILGAIVPVYTRMKTVKNHKKDLELANSQQNNDINFASTKITTKQNLTKTHFTSNSKVFQTFKEHVES